MSKLGTCWYCALHAFSSALPHRKIAGLDTALAKRIVDYRQQHGGFVNREQLKAIKGLAEKRFQQCAGFVRILPQTIRSVE